MNDISSNINYHLQFAVKLSDGAILNMLESKPFIC